MSKDAIVARTARGPESDEPRAIVDGILREMRRHMMEMSFPVAVPVDHQSLREVEAILDETIERLKSGPAVLAASESMSYKAADDHLGLGASRATRNTHPAASLIIADVLFDVALEPLAAWDARAHGHSSVVTVTRVLHHAIWRRFPAGAIGYATELRRRLCDANKDSRYRSSRELHDRIAQGIAAALQRVELSVLARGADDHLVAANAILRETFSEVQTIASELRRQLGGRTLDDALRDYAFECRDVAPPIEVRTKGRPRTLSETVGEEVYMIAIEAIRNARAHASSAHRIAVDVEWKSDEWLRLSIRDDGAGFDLRAAEARRSLGIVSMRERAALLDAELSIASELGRGTAVVLNVRSFACEGMP